MARKLNRASVPLSVRASAATELDQCYEDFVLSRKAMAVSPMTLVFYETTAHQFVRWLEARGKTDPKSISPRDVRTYLAEFIEAKAKASYVHGHARAVRTFLRFLYEERYTPDLIKFQMPPSGERERLPYLNAEEVQKVVNACTTPRDKALVMLMIDSGLRRNEVIDLNWEDLDIKTGVLNVVRGKGGKARSVVIGARTRRALLQYQRVLERPAEGALFKTEDGGRFTESGFRSALLRVGKRAGVHVSPHALRRTFATLSLRAGMNPLHLQGLLGHTTLEMTRKYIQMIDDDLVEAHHEHGPIDKFLK